MHLQTDPTTRDAPEDEDENENDISIETTHDGMLKLCCSDPQVLQVPLRSLRTLRELHYELSVFLGGTTSALRVPTSSC